MGTRSKQMVQWTSQSYCLVIRSCSNWTWVTMTSTMMASLVFCQCSTAATTHSKCLTLTTHTTTQSVSQQLFTFRRCSSTTWAYRKSRCRSINWGVVAFTQSLSICYTTTHWECLTWLLTTLHFRAVRLSPSIWSLRTAHLKVCILELISAQTMVLKQSPEPFTVTRVSFTLTWPTTKSRISAYYRLHRLLPWTRTCYQSNSLAMDFSDREISEISTARFSDMPETCINCR